MVDWVAIVSTQGYRFILEVDIQKRQQSFTIQAMIFPMLFPFVKESCASASGTPKRTDVGGLYMKTKDW